MITYRSTITKLGIKKFAAIALANKLHFPSVGLMKGWLINTSKIKFIALALHNTKPIGVAVVYKNYSSVRRTINPTIGLYVVGKYRRNKIGKNLIMLARKRIGHFSGMANDKISKGFFKATNVVT